MGPMDAIILQKLDQILDRQRDNRDLLLRHSELLLQGLDSEASDLKEEKPGIFSRLQKIPLMWQWVIGGVVSWGVSASISSYLMKGGDPVKVFEFLIGLLHAASA